MVERPLRLRLPQLRQVRGFGMGKVSRGSGARASGLCLREFERVAGLGLGGLRQGHRFSGRGLACGESLTRELHHVVEGVEFLQLSGAEVTEKDGVGLGPDQGAVLLTDFSGMHKRPVILPISGRKSSSIIAGIHYLVRPCDDSPSSSARVVRSFMSRWRPA